MPNVRSRSWNGCAAKWNRWPAASLNQQGNQPGNQQGNQPGKSGNSQGGNQPGGNQPGGRGGANQQGQGNQNGGGFAQYGGNGGGNPYGYRDQYGRFPVRPMYEPVDPKNFNPQQAIQSATQQLNDMRQMFKDNPDMQRQVGDVEREISRLQVGDISSAELQNRLNHVILPNLESLEAQMRKEVEQKNGEQVRSGAGDKVPAGYAAAVEEYFRKLSKGK
jgi:hypothetical protein